MGVTNNKPTGGTYVDNGIYEEAYYISDNGLWKYNESDSGWDIIGYCGNETVVTLPTEIDGITPVTLRISGNLGTIEHLIVPKNYTTFYGRGNNSTLKTITCSREYTEKDNVTLKSQTFIGCTNLETVILPNALIRENVYSYTKLERYDGVQLNSGMFMSCSNLKTVVFPDNLTEICSEAFKNCTSLEKITIPEGVTCISARTFDGCNNLKEITFPSTIDYFEGYTLKPQKINAVTKTVGENKAVNDFIEWYNNESGAEVFMPAVVVTPDETEPNTVPETTVPTTASKSGYTCSVSTIVETLLDNINNATNFCIYEDKVKITSDFTKDDLASLTVELEANKLYTLRVYTSDSYTNRDFMVVDSNNIIPQNVTQATTEPKEPETTQPTPATQATTAATAPTDKATEPKETATPTQATQPTTKPVAPATTPTTPAATEPSENVDNNTDDIDVEDNIILDAQTAKSQTVNKSYEAGKVVNIKINNAGNVKPKFKSSKKSVASVSTSGKITCRTKGTATITVTLNSVKVKYKIKVTNSPSIKVNNKKFKASTRYAIAKGKTIKVKITGKAKTVKNAYKSNKATVAKVTSNKTVKIKGYKKGNATVTVKVNGYKSFKIKVKVK